MADWICTNRLHVKSTNKGTYVNTELITVPKQHTVVNKIHHWSSPTDLNRHCASVLRRRRRGRCRWRVIRCELQLNKYRRESEGRSEAEVVDDYRRWSDVARMMSSQYRFYPFVLMLILATTFVVAQGNKNSAAWKTDRAFPLHRQDDV